MERRRYLRAKPAPAPTIGAHDEHIPVLRGLVDDHPERERPAALLMLALHRAGRRADALTVARDLRRYLREEHGLDPSPAVVDMERRILCDGTVAGDVDPPQEQPDHLPVDVSGVAGRSDELAAIPSTLNDLPPQRHVVQRQLPSAVMGFVGRVAELATLDALLPDETGCGAAAAVVSGTGGVGKPNPRI